jgi:ketosteroid isomerase-like protein
VRRGRPPVRGDREDHLDPPPRWRDPASFVERCRAFAELGIDHVGVVTSGPWTVGAVASLAAASLDRLDQKPPIPIRRMIVSTEHPVAEAEIRQRIETLIESIRSKDLEGVKPFYAPDIVSFDFEPPLQHVGVGAKCRNWAKVFSGYRGPIGYETRGLTLSVGVDVAFGHGLARISGRLRNGDPHSCWIRWTICLRKIDDDWLIAHDQISVPVDQETGTALLNLQPG